MSVINLNHGDSLEAMKLMADKSYDLAICDPQYGIGVGKMAFLSEMKTTVLQKNGSRISGNRNKKPYEKKDWDEAPPPQEYFDELTRVSEHQIIFGIDYMNWRGVGLGRLKWDKGIPDGVSFRRYEKAYCSLIDHERLVPLLWAGMMQAKSLAEPMTQQGNKRLNERRIHPCHKPSLLYKLLLSDYAKPGWKILDTHGGSMSIAIACHDMGFDLDLWEIDKDYYEAGVKRFENHKKQLALFKHQP